MQRIRQDDEVIIVAGKDKGSIGTITKIIKPKIGKKTSYKVVVEGLNLTKKHVKPNPNKGVVGGVTSVEMPMSISNVAIYNVEKEKADKVGLRVNEDGNKERFFKSSGETIVK